MAMENRSEEARSQRPLRRTPRIRTFTYDGGAQLYDPDTGQSQYLNDTGLFAWCRLDGRPLSAIADELMGEFEEAPADQVLADVEQMAEGLVEAGLAEPSCGLTSPSPPAEFPALSSGPRAVDLSLTGKCNLHCAYCFYADEMQGRNDLPIEEWLQFFAELETLPVQNLTLSGGEIFVRKDLWELIDAMVERGMRYSILSNGTLIREDTIAKLCEPHRRRRLTSLQVSIDGSRPEIHDASRGEGSFVKALRGLRLVKEAGLPTTVRCTVNRHNVDDLPNIAKLLLEDIGLPSFSTNDAIPLGAGCSNQADIALTREQRLNAMDLLVQLAVRYEERIKATAGPLAMARMWAEMDHARATGELPSQPKMGFLTACGCIFSKITVLHDGTLVPCTMLASLALGRINRDSLASVWIEDSTLQCLKQRRSIRMADLPGCTACEWNRFCNGSCPGVAYQLTGRLDVANPVDCRVLIESGLDLVAPSEGEECWLDEQDGA